MLVLGSNVAPVPDERIPEALAALALLRAIEDGTGIEWDTGRVIDALVMEKGDAHLQR